MSSDDEIERLREEKMKELQDRKGSEQQRKEMQESRERQKEAILKQILEPEARERLNAIQMAKPDFADKVEQQLIALAQTGRIQGKIDEEQMKSILKKLQSSDKKDFDIKRR